MSYNNLREFIERLEREGELVRVAAEVSPVEEIAELTDRMAKQPGGGKAILFERTGTDFPVVTNLMGSERRMALALGVESLDALTRRIDALLHEVTTPKATLWEKLRMLPLLGEMARWMPRSRRGRGPCQEVVLRGEAAQDLGCSPVSAFFKVVLPEILPGVISGFLMSFTFSLDDFVISYFTSGATSQTLPITIYSMTRRKVSPEINALSTIIFVIVVIVLVVKNVIERRNAVKRGVK